MNRTATILLGLAIFLLVGTAAQANTLTFPGGACAATSTGTGTDTACAEYGYVNQSYGDSAAVNITYVNLGAPGSSLRWWDTGYNDLTGVVWADGGDGPGSHGQIVISPLQGEMVTLNGFDMGSYFDTTRGSEVKILDALTSAVLLDYGTQSVGSGLTHSSFAPGISSADGLIIDWQNSAYNVGVDNVDFTLGSTSQVPEPSALILLACGLALVISARLLPAKN